MDTKGRLGFLVRASDLVLKRITNYRTCNLAYQI